MYYGKMSVVALVMTLEHLFSENRRSIWLKKRSALDQLGCERNEHTHRKHGRTGLQSKSNWPINTLNALSFMILMDIKV